MEYGFQSLNLKYLILTKDNITKIKRMATESTSGQMGQSIRVISKMTCDMIKVSWNIQMEKQVNLSGKTVTKPIKYIAKNNKFIERKMALHKVNPK